MEHGFERAWQTVPEARVVHWTSSGGASRRVQGSLSCLAVKRYLLFNNLEEAQQSVLARDERGNTRVVIAYTQFVQAVLKKTCERVRERGFEDFGRK